MDAQVEELLKDNMNLLEEHVKLLEQFTQEQYTHASQAFGNTSTIGMHIRHILDYDQSVCISYRTGIIDYENKIRQKDVEEQPMYAIAYAKTLKSELESILYTKSIDKSLKFSNNQYEYIPTTFSRELYSAIEHTIHHDAIILEILSSAPKKETIKLPNHFGIAPSTIRYQEESKK